MAKKIKKHFWWSVKDSCGMVKVNYKTSEGYGMKLSNGESWSTIMHSWFDKGYYIDMGFMPKEFITNDST